jgi:translation elongation factor P/translation initiation factor 5A
MHSMFKLLNRSSIAQLSAITTVNRRLISEKAWTAAKAGKYVLVDNVPFKVTKATQGGRGRGGSWVKCTVKNLFTNRYGDKTFGSDDMLEVPVVTFQTAQFSWHDAGSGEYVFMDNTTFEEVRVTDVNDAQFLKEGQSVTLMKYENQVVDVDLPTTDEYTVVSIDTSTPL